MDEDKEQQNYISAITGDPYFAGPARPLHLQINSWDEETRKLEDHIRTNHPFEGRWQSLVEHSRLIIPEQLRPLVQDGGYISVSTDSHLILYGKKHWHRMQRELSKHTGLEPVHTDKARHFFESLYRFDKLDDNGSIEVPAFLLEYADITHKVVLVGMVLFAEIHDRSSYMQSQKKEEKRSFVSRFRNK